MRTILILGMLMLCGGCSLLESGTKATFDIAWNAAEAVIKAKIPGMKADILAGAKEAADEALEAGIQYAAEKTVKTSQAMIDKALEKTGVNIVGFDEDGSGTITPAEFYAGWKRENEKRTEENDPPLGIGGTMWLLLATVAFTGGKSALRVWKERNGKTT